MKENFPKNYTDVKRTSNKIYGEYATNSLIMNDNESSKLMQEIQVMQAKIDVDSNHK